MSSANTQLDIDTVVVVEQEITVECSNVIQPPVVSIEVPGIQGPTGEKGDKGDSPDVFPISDSFIDNLF